MNAPGRMTQAVIDLSLLSHNLSSIKKLVSKKTKVMAVVKGNAYGHGIVPVAKHLAARIDYFGVVCLYEARQLRAVGIKKPILLLNYTDPESVADAVALDVAINVMDEEVLRAVSLHAKKQKKRVTVHVKIDSGMHRLGVMPEDATAFVKKVSQNPHVFLEGIFTHFAASDEEDLSFTYEQLGVFKHIVNQLAREGIKPPLIHAANSAAVLRVPESHFTMIRPGKILYGPLPGALQDLPFVSRPILQLRTKIVQIRQIAKGESVGYGRSFTADKAMWIAALPVGYADGFRRSPNFGSVLVRGKRAPLVGRVSMDQSSIDVSSIRNVAVGDEVVLIGQQGSAAITTEEIADRLGTINYEVLTSLAERVTRVYKE